MRLPTEFKNLVRGAKFLYETQFYIKAQKPNGSNFNAVCLSGKDVGFLFAFDENIEVLTFNGELQIVETMAKNKPLSANLQPSKS